MSAPTITTAPTITAPPAIAAPITGPLFDLGQIFTTPGAIDALAESYGNRWRIEARGLLNRHQCGDWGEIHPEDRGVNERSLQDGTRLLSVYRLRSLVPGQEGTRVWIITEADRSATTLLLPEEY